jgi:rod shape-determining protein MreC
LRYLFKNKVFLLIFATLILLVIIAMSSSQISSVNRVGSFPSIIISPFQNVFSYIGQKVQASVGIFGDIKSLRQENDDLRKKVSELNKINRDLSNYESENKKLMEELNFKSQISNYDILGANVIAKDLGNWFKVINIDRGSQDKIGVDYPVTTYEGLVGRVTQVGSYWSKIICITDPDSTVSARLSKTRDEVLIKGDISLKDQNLCIMDSIPPDAEINVDDTVETSGLGGIYPKGILIGKIKEIRQVSGNLTRYAIVEPAVDFERLEDVFVLKNKITGAGSASK